MKTREPVRPNRQPIAGQNSHPKPEIAEPSRTEDTRAGGVELLEMSERGSSEAVCC